MLWDTVSPSTCTPGQAAPSGQTVPPVLHLKHETGSRELERQLIHLFVLLFPGPLLKGNCVPGIAKDATEVWRPKANTRWQRGGGGGDRINNARVVFDGPRSWHAASKTPGISEEATEAPFTLQPHLSLC